MTDLLVTSGRFEKSHQRRNLPGDYVSFRIFVSIRLSVHVDTVGERETTSMFRDLGDERSSFQSKIKL